MKRALIAAGLLLIALGIACWLGGLDPRIDPFFRLRAGGSAVWPALILSRIGGLAGMGPIAVLVVFVLAARGRRREALWLVATVASGRLLIEGLKLGLHRARPDLIDRLDPVTSWSFPSSHSAGSMLTCMALALIVGRPWALVGAVLLSGAIGWSRLALGVHWPGDVLAGWGLALVWVGVAARWLPSTPAK